MSGLLAKYFQERESSPRASARRLVAQYGGRASKWVKKSSRRVEIAGQYFELHWYEHPGLGRFEVKQMAVKEP